MTYITYASTRHHSRPLVKCFSPCRPRPEVKSPAIRDPRPAVIQKCRAQASLPRRRSRPQRSVTQNASYLRNTSNLNQGKSNPVSASKTPQDSFRSAKNILATVQPLRQFKGRPSCCREQGNMGSISVKVSSFSIFLRDICSFFSVPGLIFPGNDV